jgi:hypothetical protein
MSGATIRLKARVRPSGEKAGLLSPIEADGADVTLRFWPVSIESKNKPKGSCDEPLSAIANDLPSGDHARLDSKKGV